MDVGDETGRERGQESRGEGEIGRGTHTHKHTHTHNWRKGRVGQWVERGKETRWGREGERELVDSTIPIDGWDFDSISGGGRRYDLGEGKGQK
jgi:hypothetical protein